MDIGTGVVRLLKNEKRGVMDIMFKRAENVAVSVMISPDRLEFDFGLLG